MKERPILFSAAMVRAIRELERLAARPERAAEVKP
jgi:hypothetical protein